MKKQLDRANINIQIANKKRKAKQTNIVIFCTMKVTGNWYI